MGKEQACKSLENELKEYLIDDTQSQALFKLIFEIKSERKIKTGINESIKAVQNGNAHIVVFALDALPLAIVAPLPVICEQRGVQCVAVGSKSALGKACNIDVDVVACAIYTAKNENPTTLINKIKTALK